MGSFVTKLVKTNLYIVSLIVFMFTGMSFAAAISSNGTGGGSWDAATTGTWAGGVIPGASDDVTIVAGDIVTLNISTTVNSITVQSGATLRFGSGTGTYALTSSGNVVNAGTITTDDAGIAFHTFYIGGNFNNTGGTFNGNQLGGVNPEGIYVDFNGSSAMVISGSPTFYKLIYSGSGSLTTSSSAMLVQSALDLQSTGGIFTLGAGEVSVEAAIINIYNSGFDATTNSSTLKFTGTSAKTIDVDGSVLSAVTFYNVKVDGADVTLKGTNSAVTFNFNNNLTLTDKQLLFDGTNESIGYGGNATVIYNGSNPQAVGNEWTASLAPASVTVDNGSGVSLGAAGLASLTGTLTLQNGAVDYSAGSLNLTVANVAGTSSGSFGLANDNEILVSAGGTITTSGTPKFHSVTTLGNATVNNNFEVQGVFTVSGGGTVTVNGNLVLGNDGVSYGSINVSNGTLDLNGTDISEDVTNSALTVGASGTLKTGGSDITQYGGGYTINGTIEFDGTTEETIPAAGTISTLVVNNAAGVVASSGILNISTALNFTSGTLTTSASNIVRLATTATISGNGSSTFVIGPLQKTFDNSNLSFAFPVGFAGTYLPATFTYASGLTSSGVVEIAAVSGTPGGTAPTGISSIGTSHYYTLQEVTTPTGFSSYNLEITWTGSGFSQNRNQVLIQNGVGPTYNYAAAASHTATTVTRTGITSFPTDNFIVAIGSSSSTIVWDGSAGDGLWSTAANWDLNEQPQTGDDVEFSGNYGATQNVTYDGSATANEFSSITVNPAGGVVNLTLTRAIALNLTAGANALVVNSGSSLTYNGTNVQMGGTGYDQTLTTYSGSVEYTADSVYVDTYSTLTINGATVTSGSGTTTVTGLLTKSGADFSTAEAFTAGSYTNTAGTATFSSGPLTVSGTTTINGGTLTGLVTVQGNVVFGGGTAGGTFTFSGGSAQTISGSGASFENLTVNKSANDVTCSTAVDLSGVLTLTAGDIITTAANLLTMGSAASVSGGSASSHVDGPLAKVLVNAIGAKFTFPIGDGTRYRRLAVEPESNNSETYTAQYFFTPPTSGTITSPLDHISSNQHWTLTNAGTVGGNVTLHWEDATDGVDQNLTPMVVAQRVASGNWESKGGTTSGTLNNPGSVRSNAISGSFNTNEFTFGSITTDNSLPVELASFNATADYGKVTLDWVTASELDNEGFNIYRRTQNELNGWAQVNENLIEGQGNTSVQTSYSFVDTKVISGQTYVYKLESVSLNGVRVEEKMVEVTVLTPQEYVLNNNFPNPFNPTTTISFLLPEYQKVSLVIYDTQGRVVRTLVNNADFATGEHQVVWDATDDFGNRAASGMYFYRITAGNFSKIHKMVLLK